MGHAGSGAAADPLGRSTGHAAGLIFFCVVAFGALAGYDKVALIALTAFGAMTAGAVLGYRATGASAAWQALDGMAGGAMIAAASILLLPAAVELDPPLAGLGVALGLLFGLALHHACRERAWRPGALGQASLIALTVHSAGAGVVIGMLYGQMPELGLWLGTVIVAHKLPAGYAIARRLRVQGGALAGVALPACAVGMVAVPVAMATTVLPPSAAVGAVCQGLAAGIFLHVGLECVALEGPGSPGLDTPGWRIWLPVGAGMTLMLLLRIAFG